VVLRIETRQAFLKLPGLLLAAMAHGAPVAVMIARSNLAIECGWEALAPIQAEILRICGAAQVPCLWTSDLSDRSQPLLTCLAFRSNCEPDDP